MPVYNDATDQAPQRRSGLGRLASNKNWRKTSTVKEARGMRLGQVGMSASDSSWLHPSEIRLRVVPWLPEVAQSYDSKRKLTGLTAG